MGVSLAVLEGIGPRHAPRLKPGRGRTESKKVEPVPAILLALLAGAPVVWLGLRLLGDAMETAGRIEQIRAE